MKNILLALASAATLSACATAHVANQQPGLQSTKTTTMSGQSAKDIADQLGAMPQTDMPTDVGVQMYNTSGPFANPMNARPRGVLDNTTSGGYTVFDEGVTVYPLPGETAPGFLPAYAVPPYKDSLEEQQPPTPGLVGKPMGLASAGILPPVKNMDVGQPDPYTKATPPRRPLTLTAPEPVTMQPPVSATAAPRSPFSGSTGFTKTTSQYDTSAAPALPDSSTPSMSAGRRSPSLTGY